MKRLYLVAFAHSNEIGAGIERENGVFDAESASEAIRSAEDFAAVYLRPFVGAWRVAELIEVVSEEHAMAYLKNGLTERRQGIQEQYGARSGRGFALNNCTSNGSGGGFTAPAPRGFDSTEPTVIDVIATFKPREIEDYGMGV
jgi:hypothetical protein